VVSQRFAFKGIVKTWHLNEHTARRYQRGGPLLHATVDETLDADRSKGSIVAHGVDHNNILAGVPRLVAAEQKLFFGYDSWSLRQSQKPDVIDWVYW